VEFKQSGWPFAALLGILESAQSAKGWALFLVCSRDFAFNRLGMRRAKTGLRG